MITIYRIVQCIWGFPQTLLGLIIYLKNISCPHYFYHGAIVTTWNSKSSLSLGMFIFITSDPFFYYESYRNEYDENTFSKMLLVHEYGHTIQSLIFGPLYLIFVGLPSILWSFLPIFARRRERNNISYFSAYPEKWANNLGEEITNDTSIGEPV